MEINDHDCQLPDNLIKIDPTFAQGTYVSEGPLIIDKGLFPECTHKKITFLLQ